MLAQADSLVVLGSRDHVPVLGDVDLYRAIGLEPAPEPAPAVDPQGLLDAPDSDVSGAPPQDDQDRWELDPAAIGPDPDDEPVMTAERASAMNRARRLSPPPKSRLGLWFFLLFLVLVAIVAAGWFGLIDVPGISPRRSAASVTAPPEGALEASAQVDDGAAAGLPVSTSEGDEAASGTPTAPADLVASSPLQAWGLRIGAFRNREVAREQADLMASRAPGHLFVVVPVEVQGTRYYRVVSSLAEEQTDAEAMRSDLATRLGSTESDQWLVRRAPMAFLVAEASTEEEALGRVEILDAAGVDTFVMALPRADGSRLFRVYAGAYANAQEAATMGALLESAGVVDAPLVERRGILPE